MQVCHLYNDNFCYSMNAISQMHIVSHTYRHFISYINIRNLSVYLLDSYFKVFPISFASLQHLEIACTHDKDKFLLS